MTAAQYPRQETTPYGVNWSPNSWKESTRLTMVKHESEFKYQLKELHRLYRTQGELMENFKARIIGQSNEQLRSTRLIKVKIQVSRDTDAPVTPENMNLPTAERKQIDQARSAAEVLVSMSSPLVWFADIVTSVKFDDDLAFVQKRARLARKPCVAYLASRQQKTQQMQMPSHHGKCLMAKKHKCVYVELKSSISSWGKIKNVKRSKRVRDKNPMYTFLRGGLLCRWR